MSVLGRSAAQRPGSLGAARRSLRADRHDLKRPPCLPEADRLGTDPLPAKLEPLVETARDYPRVATSGNTNRAYAADWRDYLRWRARQGVDARRFADPECVGFYLAALTGGRPRTVATIERRLSALARIASAIVRYSARFRTADEIGAGAEAATGACRATVARTGAPPSISSAARGRSPAPRNRVARRRNRTVERQ
jgi:hypothetical protein